MSSSLVTALKSNQYKQTFSRLRRKDCFCVLGVLGDLYIKENPHKAYWFEDTFHFDVTITPPQKKIVEKDGTVTYAAKPAFLYTQKWMLDLPIEVLDWAGLIKHEIPDNINDDIKLIRRKFPYKNKQFFLEVLNDFYRLPFNDIANILEDNL